MWYLIVPPIVIVSSILFVLWYLSRKGADPMIASKVSQLESTAGESVSFPRTKNFSLHILEKMAYRSKVMSLRMHNALNDMTQSLKEKQKHFQKESSAQEVSTEASPDETILNEAPIIRRPRIESVNVFHEESVKTPLITRKATETRIEKAEINEEDSLRPMVSETIVRPEMVPIKKKGSDIAREENLIAHIAVNPKDFSAYEELGDYYLEIGNIKDAKECYRQVLRLSPVQRMAKIKIRRLEKILLQKER